MNQLFWPISRSTVEDLFGDRVIDIRAMGNTGFSFGFPVGREKIVATDLIQGELPGAGHKLLQAAGEFVRQGPEGHGAVGDILHFILADLFLNIEITGKDFFGVATDLADCLGQFVPIAA